MMRIADRRSSRRDVFKVFGGAAAAYGAVGVAAAAPESSATSGMVKPGNTILFQGDSITDAGRERDQTKLSTDNVQIGLGNGYAWLAASQLLVEQPEGNLHILNRGISGDTLANLDARWQADCLDLKPNVLSILVGANDYGIWRERKSISIETLTADFEKRYVELIAHTRKALPNVRILLLEPFFLRAGKVDESWLPDLRVFRPAVAHVAAATNSAFLPVQTMFDIAVKIAPAERWAGDGVHPTLDGAALLAGEWLRAVRG